MISGSLGGDGTPITDGEAGMDLIGRMAHTIGGMADIGDIPSIIAVIRFMENQETLREFTILHIWAVRVPPATVGDQVLLTVPAELPPRTIIADHLHTEEVLLVMKTAEILLTETIAEQKAIPLLRLTTYIVGNRKAEVPHLHRT